MLGFACALASACGGRIDSSTDGPRTASSAGEPDDAPQREATKTRAAAAPDAASGVGSGVEPAVGGDCSSLGAFCQVFEPGGPERWGCNTLGTEPELACEHAAGASIARCNCSGRFGEGEPSPSSDAGAAPPIAWFDVPATSTPFTEDYVIQLWKEHCNGVCR